MHSQAFLSYLSTERRFSVHTITAYKNDLDQFTDFLVKDYDGVNWDEVESIHIRSYIAYLFESGISARSIRRKISAIQSFYKYLRQREGFTNNPCRNVVKPKTGKKLPGFIPVQEVNLLEKKGNQEDFGMLSDRVILMFFYCTGVRLSELTGLEHQNVDLAAGTVRVMGKRAKERIIPLIPELVKELNLYLTAKESAGFDAGGPFFVTTKGKAVSPRYIQKLTSRVIREAGISSKGNPHILRHTFATHLLNNGADINAVKDLLGHSSLAATQVYTHNTIEKLKKIHEQAHPRAKK